MKSWINNCYGNILPLPLTWCPTSVFKDYTWRHANELQILNEDNNLHISSGKIWCQGCGLLVLCFIFEVLGSMFQKKKDLLCFLICTLANGFLFGNARAAAAAFGWRAAGGSSNGRLLRMLCSALCIVVWGLFQCCPGVPYLRPLFTFVQFSLLSFAVLLQNRAL